MIVITTDEKICEALASRKVTIAPAFTSWDQEPFSSGEPVWVLGMSLAAPLKKGIKKGKQRVAKHNVFVLGEPGHDLTKQEVKQLIEAVEEAEGVNAPKWPYTIIETNDQLIDLVETARASEGMACDIETNYDKKIGDATSYPFSHPDPQILTVQFHFFPSDKTFVLLLHHAERDPSLTDAQCVEALRDVLRCQFKFIVGQNFNFDRMWLWDQVGVRLPPSDDTQLLNQLVAQASEDNDLQLMAQKHLGVVYKEMVKVWLAENRKTNYADVPISVMGPYGAWDAKATGMIQQKHLAALETDPAVYSLYRKVIVPITDVVLEMTCKGLPVDAAFLRYLEKYFQIKADWYMEMIRKVLKIRKVGNENFNPRSSKQMAKLLYDKLHLLTPPRKGKDKGKKTTGAGHLLSALHSDSLVPLIMMRNKYAKLLSEVNGYRELLSRSIDSSCPVYLHPTFNVGGTDTGRLSSSKPNGQNIDKHSGIRRMFIPSPVAEAKKGVLEIIEKYREG